MGCYGKIAFISFGDCASSNKTTTNISMSSLSETIKDKIATNNSSTSASVVNVQNQTINLTHFPVGIAPNIKIGQSMKLKIASNQKIQATIKSEDMEEFANQLEAKLNNEMKIAGDVGSDQVVQDKVTNLQTKILAVVRKSATLKAANKALFESVAVQSQSINIDFGGFNPEMTQALIAKYSKPGDANSLIEINQDLLADIQADSAIFSIVEAISKDTQVIKAGVDAIEALASKGLGLASVTSDAIKELSATTQKVSGDVKDVADTGINAAKSAVTTWIIVAGVVIVALILGFFMFGKALVGGGSSVSAEEFAPSSSSVTEGASASTLPPSSFGFGSCGYRFK